MLVYVLWHQQYPSVFPFSESGGERGYGFALLEIFCNVHILFFKNDSLKCEIVFPACSECQKNHNICWFSSSSLCEREILIGFSGDKLTLRPFTLWQCSHTQFYAFLFTLPVLTFLSLAQDQSRQLKPKNHQDQLTVTGTNPPKTQTGLQELALKVFLGT